MKKWLAINYISIVLYASGGLSSEFQFVNSDPKNRNPYIDVVRYVAEIDIRDQFNQIGRYCDGLEFQVNLEIYARLSDHVDYIDFNFIHPKSTSFQARIDGVKASTRRYSKDGVLRLILPHKVDFRKEVVKIEFSYNFEASKITDQLNKKGHYTKSIFTCSVTVNDSGLTSRSVSFTPYHLGFEGVFPSHNHFSDGASIEYKFLVPDGVRTIAPGSPLNGPQLQNYTVPISPQDNRGGGLFHWVFPEKSYTSVFAFSMATDMDFCHFGNIQTKSGPRPFLMATQLDDDKSCTQLAAHTWKHKLQKFVNFIEEHVGPYPWSAPIGTSDLYYQAMEYQTWYATTKPEQGVHLHEFLHSWFGNGIRPMNIGEAWISEGFTTYFSGLLDTYFNLGSLRDYQYVDFTDVTLDGGGLLYEHGARALHELRLDISRLVGLVLLEDKEIELFKSFYRKYYDEMMYKAIDSGIFVAFVKKTYPIILGDLQIPFVKDEVDAAITRWSKRFFSSKITDPLPESL